MSRINENKFHLKEEHIKLLKHSNITYNDHMYSGAAGIDMKRPYGNMDLYADIAEILDWELFESIDEGKILSRKQCEEAERFHREIETALQIVLCTQSFIPGIYESESYNYDSWKLVEADVDSDHSDLEMVKITLKKYFGNFHEIQSGEYTYLQPYRKGDMDGHLYVEGYGMVPLENPGQLTDFMEFHNGKIISY